MRLIWMSLFYLSHIGAMPLFQMKANLLPRNYRLFHQFTNCLEEQPDALIMAGNSFFQFGQLPG